MLLIKLRLAYADAGSTDVGLCKEVTKSSPRKVLFCSTRCKLSQKLSLEVSKGE